MLELVFTHWWYNVYNDIKGIEGIMGFLHWGPCSLRFLAVMLPNSPNPILLLVFTKLWKSLCSVQGFETTFKSAILLTYTTSS